MDAPREAFGLRDREHLVQRWEKKHACLLAVRRQARRHRAVPELVPRSCHLAWLAECLRATGLPSIHADQRVDVRLKTGTNWLLFLGRQHIDPAPSCADRGHLLRGELASMVEAGGGAREGEAKQEAKQR